MTEVEIIQRLKTTEDEDEAKTLLQALKEKGFTETLANPEDLISGDTLCRDCGRLELWSDEFQTESGATIGRCSLTHRIMYDTEQCADVTALKAIVKRERLQAESEAA